MFYLGTTAYIIKKKKNILHQPAYRTCEEPAVTAFHFEIRSDILHNFENQAEHIDGQHGLSNDGPTCDRFNPPNTVPSFIT